MNATEAKFLRMSREIKRLRSDNERMIETLIKLDTCIIEDCTNCPAQGSCERKENRMVATQVLSEIDKEVL